MEKIIITSVPHERTEKLDFEYVPTNDQEFNNLIANAPWDILKGFGFRKWDTLSNIIAENRDTQVQDTEVQIHMLDGSTHTMDLSVPNAPTEFDGQDFDVILLPGEWYNIIPEGCKLVGLWGEEVTFQKGKSDDDIRFGCLSYGILRPIIQS